MRSALIGLLTAAVLSASSVGAAEIEPYGRGTFAAIRQQHAGKPLVVHFWSVTCLPCLVEMPRLAEAARALPDLDLVLVSTDSIEQASRIDSRLTKFGFGDAKTFAYADSFEERLRFEVDKTWRGELPFTVFVTPRGDVSTEAGELEAGKLPDWLASSSR